MKTEMKKNNKMVMALAVLTALAMISIAGIALSDDSDAVVISNDIQIQPGDNVTNDFDLYVYEGDSGYFEFSVANGGKYTGTLRLGTLSADKTTYTPYCELKLTNVSAVMINGEIFEYDWETVAYFAIGNYDKKFEGALPQGDYELKQGQVLLGSPATNTTFCGTIVAGDLEVTANYVVGTIISLDSSGNTRISGQAASPNSMLPVSKTKSDEFDVGAGTTWYPSYNSRTLSLKGTASILSPEVLQKIWDKAGDWVFGWGVYGVDTFGTNNVNVTIEEDTVITAGNRPTTVAAVVTLDAEDVAWAYLIASDGWSYSASVAGASPDYIEFYDVPYGVYTLILRTAGTSSIYYGTANVSASGVTVSNNMVAAAIPSADIWVNGGYLKYPAQMYTLELAFNLNWDEKGIFDSIDTTATPSEGLIEFPDNGVLGTDNVFIMMRLNAAGSPKTVFYGTPSGGNTTGGYVDVIKSKTQTLVADEIRSTGSVEAAQNVVLYRVADNITTLTIKGQMDFLWTNDDNYAELDVTSSILAPDAAEVNFEGAGILSHGVIPADPPALPTGVVAPGCKMNAAYYYVNEKDGTTVKKSTYYFTTLANAINNSDEITLMGKHYILEDTLLDNEKFSSIKIFLEPDALLQIGCNEANPAGDIDDSISAILTIPKKTKIEVGVNADFKVINGQAVFEEVKPALPENEPQSDTLIVRKSPDKYIYTDIATALNVVSVSGDNINLRQEATLFEDATVRTGVTLNDAVGAWLVIDEDVTLIVNGTLNLNSAPMAIPPFSMNEIRGTLVVNGEANFGKTTEVALYGSILVASNGVLNFKDTAGMDDYSADLDTVLDIAGTVNVAAGAWVDVGIIILTGKASVKTGGDLYAYTELQIGTKPTLSTDSANSAVIEGVIGISGNCTIFAYGAFAIKDDTAGSKNNINSFTNGLVKTQYFIGENLYVTLYCRDDGSVLPLQMIYEDQLLDIIIIDWNNEKLLRGDWLSVELKSATPPEIGGTGWEKVYAKFEPRMYNVTFSYTPGLTWVLDGVNIDGGKIVEVAYGKSIKVTAEVQPGYEGTPVLKANGSTYTAGSAYKIVGQDVVFTASGVSLAGEKKDDGLTLIEILLIIIVIIIGIIALIVAVRLLRS